MKEQEELRVKNIHNGKIYRVFNYTITASRIIGDFNMEGSNILIRSGMFALKDVEIL